MSLTSMLLTTVVAGGVSSITDWFFMGGDWLYKRYDQHPEIWRSWPQGESESVLWASVLPFLTCGAFACACHWLHLHAAAATLALALAVWLIAPAPLLVVNALFVKVSPSIATFHALGWLIKLAVAALAFTFIAG